MICPRCNATLKETSKNGVAIDVCNQCKGVWLDRGELEKLASSSKQFHTEFDSFYQHHNKHYHKKPKPLWLQILDILD